MSAPGVAIRIGMRVGGLGLVRVVSGCREVEYPSVTGRVSLDGRPLPDAVVLFMADDEQNVPSLGIADMRGIYTHQQAADVRGTAPWFGRGEAESGKGRQYSPRPSRAPCFPGPSAMEPNASSASSLTSRLSCVCPCF